MPDDCTKINILRVKEFLDRIIPLRLVNRDMSITGDTRGIEVKR